MEAWLVSEGALTQSQADLAAREASQAWWLYAQTRATRVLAGKTMAIALLSLGKAETCAGARPLLAVSRMGA